MNNLLLGAAAVTATVGAGAPDNVQTGDWQQLILQIVALVLAYLAGRNHRKVA
jgi:hypothetical protein